MTDYRERMLPTSKKKLNHSNERHHKIRHKNSDAEKHENENQNSEKLETKTFFDENRTAYNSYQCMTKNNIDSSNEQLMEFRCYNVVGHEFWKKICLNLKQQGKKFNSGRFSKEEDEQLTKNWRRFIKKCPFEPPQLLLLRNIYGEKRKHVLKYIKDTDFYIKLGKHINRPLSASFYRARKLFHPAKLRGRFSKEEDEYLLKMFRQYGARWQQIGHLMDRRDDLLLGHFKVIKSNYARGPWTEEEDRQLIAAVKSKVLDCTDASKAFFNFPWTEIAEMVPTRYSGQCRVRWIEVLAFGKAGKQRFSRKYQIQLIHEIMKQNVNHESEIDWIDLMSKFKIPSPQFLQNRFHFLRNKIPDYQRYSLNDVLEYIEKELLKQKISKSKDVELASNFK